MNYGMYFLYSIRFCLLYLRNKRFEQNFHRSASFNLIGFNGNNQWTGNCKVIRPWYHSEFKWSKYVYIGMNVILQCNTSGFLLKLFYLIVCVVPDPFFVSKSIHGKSNFDVFFIPVTDIIQFNYCVTKIIIAVDNLKIHHYYYQRQCILHFIQSDQNGNLCMNLLQFIKMQTNNKIFNN